MTLSELKLSQLSKSNWHENADAGDRLLHTARSPARCRRRDRRESSATLDSLARCDANTLAIARMRGPSKSMESDTGSKKTKKENSKRVRASPEKATNDVTSQASPSPKRASATASSAPDQAADSTGPPGNHCACVGVGDADSAQPRTESSAAPRLPAQDTNVRGDELQQNPSAASRLQVSPLDFAGDAGFQTQKQHAPCVHHAGAPVQRQQPVYFLLQAIPLVMQAPAQRTSMGCCATPQAGYAPMTFVTGEPFPPESLMQGQQFAVPASQGHYAAASALHTCVVGSAMRSQHAAGSFSSQCVGTQMAPPSVGENVGKGNGPSNSDCRGQEL
ncbi:hypothetical protein PF010_g18128 [Phytophthora fragariae]|uniref:Uncharacterized protein n=1 Tax=Phytophthora fragariae TaxID=53985 RepID=A0A6G0NEU5_9STRA|nr:hypothetical protein PF010_g18128 [Phytophthora fragariae]KAE9205206.1 hypothetical protein PF004_g17623 [Phytophthora fragariae]